MYRILEWFPQKRTAGASFSVLLKKEWFEAVKKCELSQEKMDNLVKNLGKQGMTVEFGVDESAGSSAELQRIGIPGKHICCAFFIDRKELEKYK